jgi:DNA-binding NarL/FixJ family response regulator
MKQELNILIADDHIDVRNGIRHMLQNQHVYNFNFFEATDGTEVFDVIKENKIDVILLDISMPNMTGLEAIKELKHLKNQIPVIILSMHKEVSFIKRAYLNGALSYLLKTSNQDEIVLAIRTVLKGEKFFINDVANILFDDLDSKTKNQVIYLDNYILSKREVQIIRFYVKNLTSENISIILSISKRTIEGHRRNIYKKLGIKNMAELIAYAYENGFAE